MPLYPAGEKAKAYLRPIVRRIGATKLRDITPQFVRHLARQMYPDAATDTWQRQVVTPIRSVINNAHELGKCPPIRIRAFSRDERVAQDLARGQASREARTPGSWPWVLAFAAAAHALGMPRYGALAWFMFRHGYRLTQSIAMTRSADMDLSRARLRIHAAKGHSAHWVDIDSDEVAMIANLPAPYRGQARDRVFTVAGGRSGALYRDWRAICARAGIDYLPPHSAGRHGYGTEMVVRQQIDPVTASHNLWADPSVMLKTYSHTEDAPARIRAAMAAGQRAARTKRVQRKPAKHAKPA